MLGIIPQVPALDRPKVEPFVRELDEKELPFVFGGQGNGGGTVTVTLPGGGQVHVSCPEGTHPKVTYVAGKGGAGGIDIGGGTVTVECVPN
ncbi:MAG: hypothetical protein D6740_04820 [Alphaproteobacteria bacterium]|nr:MAG: hypothetical protein D6740_04820 [Alphaproteobacteria bacterium]